MSLRQDVAARMDALRLKKQDIQDKAQSQLAGVTAQIAACLWLKDNWLTMSFDEAMTHLRDAGLTVEVK